MQATIGVELRCTSGNGVADWARFVNLAVNTKRKFRASFGPDTYRLDAGTTFDFEESISGALNRARSKMSGTWHVKETYYDNAGAATDTCDSGTIRWTAKQ